MSNRLDAVDELLDDFYTDMLEQLQREESPSMPTLPIDVYVSNPSATAFMIYSDARSGYGIHSILRARKEYGWLIRWNFLNGEETDVRIRNVSTKSM